MLSIYEIDSGLHDNLQIIIFAGTKASAGKLVHMKVVDDKLRIIDDVPSSAVEMAVKEKVKGPFINDVTGAENALEMAVNGKVIQLCHQRLSIGLRKNVNLSGILIMN